MWTLLPHCHPLTPPDHSDRFRRRVQAEHLHFHRCRVPHHTLRVRVHEGTPEPLMQKAIELVKTGNLEMLKVYLKGTFVSEAAKIECIKLGNLELIESYMMNQGRFSEEAQDALIKLGNAKLIESYCCHWGFCNKLKGAAKEVLERYYAKAE